RPALFERPAGSREATLSSAPHRSRLSTLRASGKESRSYLELSAPIDLELVPFEPVAGSRDATLSSAPHRSRSVTLRATDRESRSYLELSAPSISWIFSCQKFSDADVNEFELLV